MAALNSFLGLSRLERAEELFNGLFEGPVLKDAADIFGDRSEGGEVLPEEGMIDTARREPPEGVGQARKEVEGEGKTNKPPLLSSRAAWRAM